MSHPTRHTALIAGGAGFIGSHVTKRFHGAGYAVTVIDGFLEQTGGREENLFPIIANIKLINREIDRVDGLAAIVDQSDVIVDCMAWTSHLLALQDPIYDLTLNAESHLHLIRHVPDGADKKIIFLGSRGQYGKPPVATITEDTPMLPEDVQGIHKLAAESYYRVYAKLKNLNVASLRFPACFGVNQPTSGRDIGLIGGFIRDLLEGKSIEVYGRRRRRYFVYADDLAEVVFGLSTTPFCGFSAFNYSGMAMFLEDLANKLIEVVGRGSYKIQELPAEISHIDIGDADFSDQRLHAYLGEIQKTDQDDALSTTVAYFRGARRDN